MSCTRFALFAFAGLSALAFAGDDAAPAGRAKAMRDITLAVRFQTEDGAKVEPLDEPSYRWDDPARKFGDGTVWAYGKTGRPAALLTLSLYKNGQSDFGWLHELTALTDAPFSARSDAGWSWSPRRPALRFQPIPNASDPAADEAKRHRQMGEQARRFKAFEFFDPTGEEQPRRYELRLLTKPVHRYKDPARGIADGGVFLLTYGRNPEVVLVVEARDKPESSRGWAYGLSRIAMAELHVTLDDKELPGWPSDESRAGPNEAYYIFGQPALGLDAEP